VKEGKGGGGGSRAGGRRRDRLWSLGWAVLAVPPGAQDGRPWTEDAWKEEEENGAPLFRTGEGGRTVWNGLQLFATLLLWWVGRLVGGHFYSFSFI
jgi:hypothetical protein